jgi:outer membrane protein assembly factor BamD
MIAIICPINRNFAHFMKFVVRFFVVTLLFCSCAGKMGKILKSKDKDYKYKMAEQYYANKKYAQAQEIFDDVYPYFKGTDKFEDLSYKYAYCAYYLADYENAENLFKNYVESFPTSARAEECEYMRAYSVFKKSPKVDLDQTNTSKAMALMQAFINTHSDSQRIKDATDIIDKCHDKLELKELKAAQLYFNLSLFKASAVSYDNLMNDYPESDKSDDYKMHEIQAYYRYAQQSIPLKQEERFEKVLVECNDFYERFGSSAFKTQVDDFKQLSSTSINKIKNEQTKETSGR